MIFVANPDPITQPTEAGWYWFEGTLFHELYGPVDSNIFISVVENDYRGMVAEGMGDDGLMPVEWFIGTWYGPLNVERIKAMHSGVEEIDPVYGIRWAQ